MLVCLWSFWLLVVVNVAINVLNVLFCSGCDAVRSMIAFTTLNMNELVTR